MHGNWFKWKKGYLWVGLASLTMCTSGLLAAPVHDLPRLAEKHGPMVVFTVPETTFDCLRKKDFDDLGSQTAVMRTINGTGCQAVINNWTGAAVTPDGLTWWFVAHGGHDAYGGNEVYRLDLTSDRPWSLHSLPSPRARYEVAENGKVTFLEDAQWRGCIDAVASMKARKQARNARACTKYGPPASHSYSMHAYMNGKIYLRAVSSFASNMAILPGAWIFDPNKACIEAERARKIDNLGRLNPQNVTPLCDPTEAWTYLGQRVPGIITPLPLTNRVLYSWSRPEKGALEDGDGDVIRHLGAFGGTVAQAMVQSQWIPSLQLGVINKGAERWFYVSAEGEVYSPNGVRSKNAFARVDTSTANKKLAGHFSYDAKYDDFLILQDTRLFRISRRDLEDDDQAKLVELKIDWGNVRNPRPMPYNGFVYIESADVHCMMNRGNLGEQILMCFRYEPSDHFSGKTDAKGKPST